MHDIEKEIIMDFINYGWDKAAKAYAEAHDTFLPQIMIDQAWFELTNWEDMETIASTYFDRVEEEEVRQEKRAAAVLEQVEMFDKREVIEHEALVRATPIDMVNSPNHYTAGKFEVIDVIKDWLTEEEFRGYIKGNIIKYIARERLKNGNEDMKKSIFYLNYLMYGVKSDGSKPEAQPEVIAQDIKDIIAVCRAALACE